jgi:hypothetical protein
MAARGHQGLPMQAQAGGPPTPMGGGLPPGPAGPPPAGLPSPMPGGPSGPPSGPPPGDRQIASTAAEHLLAAAGQAHDPALKAAFSTAVSALHKYLAGMDKEHHQALAGKLSPRLMAQAHGV